MVNAGNATKPRTDNMPAKVTAHTVRSLAECSICGGFGDRRLMLEFNGGPAAPNEYHHTSCYALANAATLHTLSPSNLARLRLCDLAHLTDKQLDQVLVASKEHSRDGYGRYAKARVRDEVLG